MIELSWVAWAALAAMYIATIIAYGDLRAKRIKNEHAYRMKRLEYDEKAVDDATDEHEPEPEHDRIVRIGGQSDDEDRGPAQCIACGRRATADELAATPLGTVCNDRKCRARARWIGEGTVEP